MIKQFYFKQFTLASPLLADSLNDEVHSFNVQQFYLAHHTQARVDLGVMAMKGVLCITQNSNGASPTDCLVSYTVHSLG